MAVALKANSAVRHLRRVRHVKAAPWKRTAAAIQPHTQHTSTSPKKNKQCVFYPFQNVNTVRNEHGNTQYVFGTS